MFFTSCLPDQPKNSGFGSLPGLRRKLAPVRKWGCASTVLAAVVRKFEKVGVLSAFCLNVRSTGAPPKADPKGTPAAAFEHGTAPRTFPDRLKLKHNAQLGNDKLPFMVFKCLRINTGITCMDYTQWKQ